MHVEYRNEIHNGIVTLAFISETKEESEALTTIKNFLAKDTSDSTKELLEAVRVFIYGMGIV